MYDGGTPEETNMCDLILNQINELTQTIESEFPGAQMPDWLRVLIHAPATTNAPTIHTASNKNIIDILMEWCDKKYKRLDDPTKFKNNWINPEKAVFTVSAAIDVCNRMRDSMKLPIKILAHELREIQQKVGNGKHILDETEINNLDEFDTEDGYPDYYVKSGDFEITDYSENAKDYKAFVITIPDEMKTKLLQAKEKVEAFRIKFRKNTLHDEKGNRFNEFYIYAENGEIKSPIITKDNNKTSCSYYHTSGFGVGIAFDVRLELAL